MKNYVNKPKIISIFNNSRKERKCWLDVHPSFLDSFVNQGIKPYFRLSCINNTAKRDIEVLDFDMKSYIDISEYYEN